MFREPAFYFVYGPAAVALGFLTYTIVQAYRTAPVQDPPSWEEILDHRAVAAEFIDDGLEDRALVEDTLIGLYDWLEQRERGELA